MTEREKRQAGQPYWRHFERHTGTDIKRSVTTMYWTPTENKGYDGLPIYKADRQGVLVGLNDGEGRLRYPDDCYSKVQYLTEASNDLKSLMALFICDLVPAGVLADRLEEEYPAHAEAATILRRWAELKAEGA